MTYELAKELKDKGFPQKKNNAVEKIPDQVNHTSVGPHDRIVTTVTVYYSPTLDELIEACGDGFKRLEKFTGPGWYAQSFSTKDDDDMWKGTGVQVCGKTSVESAGRLWLALQDKK